MRTCLDCGHLTTATRCVDCERRRQRARNAARPGHRAEHARMRAALAPGVEWKSCARCGKPIGAAAWDADRLPSGAWAASHASCNRAAH